MISLDIAAMSITAAGLPSDDTLDGKVVFNTVGSSSKCHKILGEGKEVGPDLSEIGSKLSREDMFVAILNPSAAVRHNNETYSVLTSDGVVFTGTLINQTDELAIEMS